ncbi:MAG: sigma-70 family RNA polymerase sigma factor [candidate division Zixibacteria bacterium]|nr:sigma-70 family RNA polymerase sigma factor [candidate division Zixibacteria bacterium]
MARASEFDEHDVVRRCRAGDGDAWRALVERYQDMVYSIARRVAGAAADDAAQETFLRVFRKLHTYRGDGARAGAKFSSWLYRVAYNCACDVASARRAASALPEGYDPPDDGPGPEELAAGAEHKRITREALASIRPEYRNVLELYYLTGKSYEQVAEVADLPLGTVKSYIYRGKKEVLASLRRMGVADALAGGM